MIHRVQAPETAVSEPTNTPVAPRNTGSPAGEDAQNAGPSTAPNTPSFSIMNILRADMQRYPNLRWIVPAVIVLFLLFSGIVPQATPIFLCALYSFWVPQIWRNARRGNRKALQWRFVIGQSLARLALPLCELTHITFEASIFDAAKLLSFRRRICVPRQCLLSGKQ